MTALCTLTPVDVLYLRGNKLFADASVHGDALFPPWPSVVAGALRSRMLVDAGVNPTRYGAGEARPEGAVGAALGTADAPGSFRVTFVALLRNGEGGGEELLVPAPADVVVTGADRASRRAHRVAPAAVDALWGRSSAPLPAVPLLRVAGQAKPMGGCWLNEAGVAAHLRGGPLDARTQVVSQRELWKTDPRLGIGMDPVARRASEGMLYTSETVALAPGVRLLVGVAGADGALPEGGLVRLGGDGRGAAVASWRPGQELPWDRLPGGPRFTMVLPTPGIFPGGWVPPGVREEEGGRVLSFRGLRARLVAAAVPRLQVVSGWDLARWQPKAAQRVVPAGAVYWFEAVSGDVGVLADLRDEGLWPLMDDLLSGDDARLWRQRRAEGFNNAWFGEWAEAPGSRES